MQGGAGKQSRARWSRASNILARRICWRTGDVQAGLGPPTRMHAACMCAQAGGGSTCSAWICCMLPPPAPPPGTSCAVNCRRGSAAATAAGCCVRGADGPMLPMEAAESGLGTLVGKVMPSANGTLVPLPSRRSQSAPLADFTSSSLSVCQHSMLASASACACACVAGGGRGGACAAPSPPLHCVCACPCVRRDGGRCATPAHSGGWLRCQVAVATPARALLPSR